MAREAGSPTCSAVEEEAAPTWRLTAMAKERGECVVIHTQNTRKTSLIQDLQLSMAREAGSPTCSAVEEEAAPTWRFIGEFEILKQQRCRRVYSKKGSKNDLGLFFNKEDGTFHAMGAWCGHMGGPLYEGDIEDYKGKAHVMCPWHAYMFDIKTGKSDIGLEQSTYIVRVDDGKVFILHSNPLSVNPYL
ncbi:Rieske domain-containing protein-like [Littorina saxatilis]|uniref:Rieske domain-containing protein-like n=1 Tax=Littorina saxatilis TaxID=31220 RepID=UPI0038B59838